MVFLEGGEMITNIKMGSDTKNEFNGLQKNGLEKYSHLECSRIEDVRPRGGKKYFKRKSSNSTTKFLVCGVSYEKIFFWGGKK